eukprot:scpid75677/ scgid23667/ 
MDANWKLPAAGHINYVHRILSAVVIGIAVLVVVRLLQKPAHVLSLTGKGPSCKSILFLVTFNRPFYGNVQLLRRLYSPVAGKLVFYGPVRNVSSGVRQMKDTHHGFMQQLTIAQAWRENPGHDGILWLADDLFVNVPLIFADSRFNWERTWLWEQTTPLISFCEGAAVTMTLDHLTTKVWPKGNPYVYESDKDAGTLQTCWRRDLPERFRKRQIQLFKEERLFKHGADFGYIPKHLMGEFLAVVNVPTLSGISFETFLPTVQRLLSSSASDVIGWNGRYFWHGECPRWQSQFDCKQHHFMHPVKLSSQENRDAVQNLSCSPLWLSKREIKRAMGCS